MLAKVLELQQRYGDTTASSETDQSRDLEANIDAKPDETDQNLESGLEAATVHHNLDDGLDAYRQNPICDMLSTLDVVTET